MQVAGAHAPAIFGPRFGDERAAHRPLSADPDARQQPERGKLPYVGHERGEKRERRVAEDRQHQRPDAAEPIGDGSPDHRESPADEEQREQHAAVEADVSGRGCDAGFRQQLGQRGSEDERVDERVHAVERPPAPRRPEPADLIGSERRTACGSKVDGRWIGRDA